MWAVFSSVNILISGVCLLNHRRDVSCYQWTLKVWGEFSMGLLQRQCRKLMDAIWVQILRRPEKNDSSPVTSCDNTWDVLFIVSPLRLFCTSSRIRKVNKWECSYVLRCDGWSALLTKNWILNFSMWRHQFFWFEECTEVSNIFFSAHLIIQLGIILLHVMVLNININCL